ncbi:MAG: hypothetical protein Q7U05_01125 [Polaromonas sp.]|nr:hypothetical protein [Polaromonas sp.]
MESNFVDPNDSLRAFTPEQVSALMAGVGLRFHGQRGTEPTISRIRDDIKAGLISATEGTIDRAEVVRYLKEQNIRSDYQFDLTNSNRMTGWPWGSHHTELLGHLAAAARRYWGDNYDPLDTSTAPTNATVSEWLQTKHKVSRTMADSIASILRPDGLPTGPRK